MIDPNRISGNYISQVDRHTRGVSEVLLLLFLNTYDMCSFHNYYVYKMVLVVSRLVFLGMVSQLYSSFRIYFLVHRFSLCNLWLFDSLCCFFSYLCNVYICCSNKLIIFSSSVLLFQSGDSIRYIDMVLMVCILLVSIITFVLLCYVSVLMAKATALR